MKTAILGTIVAACLLFVMIAAADDEIQRKTLAGLQGVAVEVVPLDDPQVERDGLSPSAIQTDVELRLRQAGIPVLSREQSFRTPGKPFLVLSIGALKATPSSGLDIYPYSIKLTFEQLVILARSPGTRGLAVTWSATGKTGVVGRERLSTIRDNVRDMVDQFINAYLAANPKK